MIRVLRARLFISGAVAVFALLLLSRSAVGQAEASPPQYSAEDEKPWALAIMAGGNAGIPQFPFTFDYYRGISSGFGYDLDILVHLSGDISLRGTISRSGIKAKSDPTVIGSEGFVDYVYRNFDVSATRFFLSAQYSYDFFIRSLREKSLGKTIVSVNLGLGVVRHRFSVSSVTFAKPPGTAYPLPVSDTQTKFALTYGFNYTQMLGRTVGFFVAPDNDLVFLGSSSDAVVHWRENSGVAFMTYIHVGLIVRLK